MYHGPPGLPPNDPELTARYGHKRTFRERFEGTLIAVGALIGVLVVLSIIGGFL
jgi:hypothetical protein